MFFILIAWLVLFLAIASLGSLACRALPPSAEEPPDIFQRFWIGFGLLVAGVQLASLFVPIDFGLQVVALLLCLAGLPSLWRHVASRRASPWLVASGSVALLLALRAAAGAATRGCAVPYDTDLYHFSSVRWMNEFAAVPGLANLHCRLAKNSAFLLFSALVDNGIWDLRSAWITGGLLLLVVTAQFVHVVAGQWRNEPRRAVLFSAFGLPYLLRAVFANSPGLYYDQPALIVQMVLLLELLRFPAGRADALRRPRPGQQPGPTMRVALILVLSILGFSIKPSGAVFMVLGILFAGTAAVRVLSFRNLAAVSAIPALILVGWLARNAVLSGWLFYPAPAGRLDVDWAVPERSAARTHGDEMQTVAGQYQIIKAWARVPGPKYVKAIEEGAPYWLPRWLHRHKGLIEMKLFWAGTALLVLYLGILTVKGRPRVPRELLLAAFPLLSLAFWFASAPDMRFADAYFWMLVALALSGILSLEFFPPRAAAGAAAVLFVVLCGLGDFDWRIGRRVALWHTGRARPLPVKPVVIENNQVPPLVVFVPEEGDQCGDAALPCTPYPRNSLMMREPGSLREGFRVQTVAGND